MPDPTAHPLSVPLLRNLVYGPELRTGPHSAVLFPLEEADGFGRIDFEELDAVRECRGEYLPYELGEEDQRGTWVYEVANSSWLLERHAYEMSYEHPLIPEFTHYIFAFHDQFIEAICRGIW